MQTMTAAGDALAIALDAASITHHRDVDTFTIPLPTGHAFTVDVDHNAAGRVAYFLTLQDDTGTFIPGTESEHVAPAARNIANSAEAMHELAIALTADNS